MTLLRQIRLLKRGKGKFVTWMSQNKITLRDKGIKQNKYPVTTQLHKSVYNLIQHSNKYQVCTFQYQMHNSNTKHREQKWKHKTRLNNKYTLILTITQNKIHVTRKYTIKISWVTSKFKETSLYTFQYAPLHFQVAVHKIPQSVLKSPVDFQYSKNIKSTVLTASSVKYDKQKVHTQNTNINSKSKSLPSCSAQIKWTLNNTIQIRPTKLPDKQTSPHSKQRYFSVQPTNVAALQT